MCKSGRELLILGDDDNEVDNDDDVDDVGEHGFVDDNSKD